MRLAVLVIVLTVLAACGGGGDAERVLVLAGGDFTEGQDPPPGPGDKDDLQKSQGSPSYSSPY